MSVCRKLLVRGIVQGVSYRKSTQRIANDLGVKGWVRNLADGSVEVFLKGETQAVETLTAWCAFGPRKSRVDEVLVYNEQIRESFADFTIRENCRTA